MKKVSSLSDIILKTESVGVTYQETIVALENVSLNVPAAKLTAILGPSGCGKTTLLKVIAGLIEPTTGKVIVGGKEIIGPGPDRALVFQDFALLPWATVLQNVAFGLLARGVPKKEREEKSQEDEIAVLEEDVKKLKAFRSFISDVNKGIDPLFILFMLVCMK